MTTKYYQTQIELTAETTYVFKVRARNSVGLSAESVTVSILPPKLPDAPLNLANVPFQTNAYQIGLSWQDGVYNGGSLIFDY